MGHPKDSLSGVLLIAEFDASELFDNENDSWKFALKHAEFQHNEDVCEFMFYIGGETKAFLDRIGMHSDAGCPQDLISYLKYARDIGAKWAMFYA